MAKYLAMWEVDTTRVPVNPKERSEGWSLLLNMVKQDMTKGPTKDWGAFVGTINGYCIFDGDDSQIHAAVQQYVPFASFKLYPIIAYEKVVEVVRSLGK